LSDVALTTKVAGTGPKGRGIKRGPSAVLTGKVPC